MAMNFVITGKQMDVGESLRRHIEESIGAYVGKYFGAGIEGHVVMHREAHLYCCDVSVHVARGILVQAHEKDVDPYTAADKAGDRVSTRLRRYKRRLRDHHNGVATELKQQTAFEAQYTIFSAAAEAAAPESADDELENDGIDPTDGAPLVIAEMTTPVPELTVSEAVMRLDLGDLPALMFRNSAHGGLNMVYRRHDGQFGWVDPGTNAPSGSRTG